ncbi:hypothetical protein GGC47_002086 [Bosea sp. OAE752]|jgi:hypothetical protein|uniref:Protamine-2 (Modular protein) n=1 Tax=Bosea spartocytisi TaxID=2773451 RepID=A0A927EAY6_9HYPH|nr:MULTISPECIES: hypothetical protein [Bosea]MBD3847509.1 hypothetical protein [Bosea spartocytisi]MCT4474572.1 hypothetical protein [Bosea spartocytisi]
MERRSFLLGLFALSAGAATVAVAGKADAAGLGAAGQALGAMPSEKAATLPDGTPIEQVQYSHRPHPGHRPRPPYHRPRPRRQVCTVHRNRFGRPVRVCRWVY